MTTSQLRHEQYSELRQQAGRHMRYFNFALPAAVGCLMAAGHYGPHDGWAWFLMSAVVLFAALWSLIEARYFEIRADLCLLKAEPSIHDEE